MDDARRSLTDCGAPLLDALEPLSPASMQIFERPLRVGDWSRVNDNSSRAPPVAPTFVPSYKATMTAGTTDTDREPAEKAARKARGDAKANLRRNRHRESEKRDLMYLRACSQLLEQRLEQLKLRQASLTDDQRRDASLRQSRAELWRSLAMRRRHERSRSEKKNARLRALWRSQQRFVEQLQQLAAAPRGLGPANGHEARVTFSNFDADVLAMLARDLDTLYDQSGRVLADMGLVDVPDACFASIRSRGSSNPGDVDLVDVALLQTNYSALRQLTWERILSKFLARGGVRIDTSPHQSHRTLAMKIRYHATPDTVEAHVSGTDKGENMFFEIVLALRQYIVSPDRDVVVWKSLNTGDGELSGQIANETGYSVMYQSIENPQLTTLKRVRRLELMSAAAEEKAPEAELFSNLSLAVMEDDVKGALRVFNCGKNEAGGKS